MTRSIALALVAGITLFWILSFISIPSYPSGPRITKAIQYVKPNPRGLIPPQANSESEALADSQLELLKYLRSRGLSR